MTEATKMITSVSLFDAAKVAQEEKNGSTLFTNEDVEKTCQLMQPVAYDVPFTRGEYTITFRDAGHILGSSSIEIKDSQQQTIVFSGDLGNSPQDLILPTTPITRAQTVVIESTYGDRLHPEEDVSKILQQEINAIERTGGVLLIPAFSIERTQEILHRLHHLKENRVIKSQIPVYLDSPMAIEVTQIFTQYPKLYNSELAQDSQPFDFANLISTRSVEESKAIIHTHGPKIIIAGSGMMSGGRILHHLKNYISLPTTRLLIVGYQAAGTLGRTIENGAAEITLYNQKLPIRATITKLATLSSHADQSGLLSWLQHIQAVEKVFLVHGEDRQRELFAEKIKKGTTIKNVILPTKNQEFEIE